MNRHQKVALWVGALIVVAMFLYPPWHSAFATGATIDHGYAFLTTGPQFADGDVAGDDHRAAQFGCCPFARINYPRLAAQWFLVAVVTAAAIATLKDKGL